MAPHERDALVNAYEHLNTLPRAPEALHMLQKIASVVKPIMRTRGWKVGTLTEFFPPQQTLLGVNINRGARICLRLRYPTDNTQFMPLENVIDTMLHELSHNVHGPHNESFHNLWNALRDEYTDMKIKGYSGEGFLSEGYRLGGRRVPVEEVRRAARTAAEKRKVLQKGSGQKLGGRPIQQGSDVRSIIADATQRRIEITKGCASGTQDGDRIAEEASFNGFRTKAEEDDANERAINQALWELVQEDEARKAGVAPENNSWASEGLTWNPDTGLELSPSSSTENIPTLSRAPTIPPKSSLRRPVPLDTLHIPAQASPQVPEASKPKSAVSRSNPLMSRANSQLSRSQSTRLKPYSRPDSTPAPMLQPTVFQASPSNASGGTEVTKPSEDLPILSPTVFNGATPTLAPMTYKPPVARSPGSNSSPVGVDISGYDDDYHGTGGVSSTVMRPAASSLPSRTWTCPACTLCNRIEHLCCDVCGAEKPSRDETPVTPIDARNDVLSDQEIAQIAREISRREREQELEAAAAAERARLYGLAPGRVVTGPIGWSCSGCGSFMENQWWTCSACGRLKDSS